jgi:hypothetical protein
MDDRDTKIATMMEYCRPFKMISSKNFFEKNILKALPSEIKVLSLH